jgi:hypothetical protein
MEKEIKNQLDELFSHYNKDEIRNNFHFARFYGYCEGILMYKEAITLEDFKTGFNYALECTVKELEETKQLEEVK